MNHRAYVAIILNVVSILKDFSGVTGSHVQCTNGNISETVQDSATVTTDN